MKIPNKNWCIDVLNKPKFAEANIPQVDPYALYVSAKLESLDKPRRVLAEKRINDVLFELKYEDFQNVQTNASQFNIPPQMPCSPANTYAAMLQSNVVPNDYGQ